MQRSRHDGGTRASALVWLLAAIAFAASLRAAPPIDRVIITSPGAMMRIELFVPEGLLEYVVVRDRTTIIEPSRTGIRLDGVDLGSGVTLGAVETYRVDEEYTWRDGVRINQANGGRVTIEHRATGVRYGVELRAYDTGVALRTIVPAAALNASTAENSRVTGAATMFRLPPGSTTWSRKPGRQNEAACEERRVEEFGPGQLVAPPLVARLPGISLYLAIAEADLRDYPRMVLHAEANRLFREQLTTDTPAGAAPMPGRGAVSVTTPWRVVAAAPDPLTLLTTDLLLDLSAPENRALTSPGLQTPCLKAPGR